MLLFRLVCYTSFFKDASDFSKKNHLKFYFMTHFIKEFMLWSLEKLFWSCSWLVLLFSFCLPIIFFTQMKSNGRSKFVDKILANCRSSKDRMVRPNSDVSIDRHPKCRCWKQKKSLKLCSQVYHCCIFMYFLAISLILMNIFRPNTI